MCHLRGQNLANAVSELLHPEHGTLYRYISVRQPSADNSSSLGSKLISSNAPTYDFYLRELLRSELTYLLTYLQQNEVNANREDGMTDQHPGVARQKKTLRAQTENSLVLSGRDYVFPIIPVSLTTVTNQRCVCVCVCVCVCMCVCVCVFQVYISCS